MAIKSEVKPDEASGGSFPRLMQRKETGEIVMFYSKRGEGTVVKSDLEGFAKVGLQVEWDISEFTDFHGQIALSNSD